MTAEYNGPLPFPGTGEDIADNIASHQFTEGYCVRCGSKPHHVAASWPCGADVPTVGTLDPDELFGGVL